MSARLWKDRRYFIGGSDARVIMGDDEAALIRLWREKRGEIEPVDLSSNLVVQLGLATEELTCLALSRRSRGSRLCELKI
jgi:predicted phage-related endonuclease